MRPMTLLLTLTLWLAGGPATAAIVLHYDLDALASQADEVVHGRVVTQTSYWDDQVILTEVTLEVLLCLKGERAAGDTVVVVQQGGVVGDLAMLVPGMPTFVQGEEVVLFLEDASVAQVSLVLGMAQGKFVVEADPESGERWVRRELTGLSRVFVDGPVVRPFEPDAPHGHEALERPDLGALRELTLAEQVRRGPVIAPFDGFMAELQTVLREVAP
jgi:hypothetical protein